MITIAICLVYYGIAVWLYQVYLWSSSGHWVSIPVMAAWQAGFGVPATDHTLLGTVSRWLLDWPLSLAFLVLGVGILAAVAGLRRWRAGRSRTMRRKWITEQCAEAGYKPWSVPKILADLETSAPLREAGGRRQPARPGTERYWR